MQKLPFEHDVAMLTQKLGILDCLSVLTLNWTLSLSI